MTHVTHDKLKLSIENKFTKINHLYIELFDSSICYDFNKNLTMKFKKYFGYLDMKKKIIYKSTNMAKMKWKSILFVHNELCNWCTQSNLVISLFNVNIWSKLKFSIFGEKFAY